MRIGTHAYREEIVRRWASELALKSRYPQMYRLLNSLSLCAGCLESLPVIGESNCQRCGREFIQTREATEARWCRDCRTWSTEALEGNRSLLRYNEWGRDLLGLYKYRGDERLSRFFGTLLAITVYRYFQPEQFDCLIAVPLHQKRLQERGFNQMDLLADTLSEEIGIPAKKWLQRTKETPKLSQQTGREARQTHMRDAFSWSGELREIRRKKNNSYAILLLDDIYTTGSTLRACADTIRTSESEACSIWSLTIYR
jgi:competence protein ComFC